MFDFGEFYTFSLISKHHCHHRGSRTVKNSTSVLATSTLVLCASTSQQEIGWHKQCPRCKSGWGLFVLWRGWVNTLSQHWASELMNVASFRTTKKHLKFNETCFTYTYSMLLQATSYYKTMLWARRKPCTSRNWKCNENPISCIFKIWLH